MGSCLLFSLDIAFFIGIVISIASYLKRAAVPHVVEYAFDPKGRLVVVSQKKKIRRRIRIIGIGGELFFGSVDVFQTTLQEVAKNTFVKSIVLRLNNVYYMDASMCFAILSLYEYLKSKKKHLVISGITKELWQVFLKAKLVETIGEDNLFISDEAKPQLSTWNACVRAQKLST
jgi:SulP family sulfate permease